MLFVLALGPQPAFGQTGDARDWVETKCALYRSHWRQALDQFDSAEFDPSFVEASEAFMASGCTGVVAVCPRTAMDFEIANAVTIALMNEGAASTFLPFRCPTEPSHGGWTGPGL